MLLCSTLHKMVQTSLLPVPRLSRLLVTNTPASAQVFAWQGATCSFASRVPHPELACCFPSCGFASLSVQTGKVKFCV